MLETLKSNLLARLYNHPDCDHKALLVALVAYKAKDISDNDYYSIVDNLNQITNQAWQLEVL